MSQAKILVVDDDATIRAMLSEWLSEKYAVRTVNDGMEALEVLETESFDLVLSDINMPRMNGFETIRRIRQRFKSIKTALITDYNVDSYIKIALEEGITNIIVKNAPFEVDELFRTIDNLLTGERVFGMENYLSNESEIMRTPVRTTEDIEKIREAYIIHLEAREALAPRLNTLRMVFEEIASNALYHAYGYEKFKPVDLKDGERVEISYGSDDSRVGFAVLDNSGRLTKEIVLKKIIRAMSQDGILDTSGRGLFLSRSFSDRFIINIRPGEKTEIIVLNNFSEQAETNKPLYINQLG